MPVYRLTDELIFPPPEGASPEGVVAIGGDFSPERLILAYSQGIFPWPTEGFPLLWFSPDPRFVLEPREGHAGRSLRKTIRRGTYRVTSDQAFSRVIRACSAEPRPGQSGTWITDDLTDAFEVLHARGLAHSIEAWRDDALVGGVYGLSMGGVFFGESMFAHAPDASKVAFCTLLGNLVEWGFSMVDCQVYTDHLARFGAEQWDRSSFLAALHGALQAPTRRGPWSLPLDPQAALARIRPA